MGRQERETMLIFTRRQGQTFRVGDDITITVMRIDKHNVSIGINAPQDVPVHREDVWQRIQEEKAFGKLTIEEKEGEA